jgi:hypothetical protein
MRDASGKTHRSSKAVAEFRYANPCPATGKARGCLQRIRRQCGDCLTGRL